MGAPEVREEVVVEEAKSVVVEEITLVVEGEELLPFDSGH